MLEPEATCNGVCALVARLLGSPIVVDYSNELLAILLFLLKLSLASLLPAALQSSNLEFTKRCRLSLTFITHTAVAGSIHIFAHVLVVASSGCMLRTLSAQGVEVLRVLHPTR